MRSESAKGFIDDDLFHAILSKLQREFSCRQLHFYNWTEPLLHPRIVSHCRDAADAGFHVHLSSNLNHLPNAEGLMTSGIKTFRISLSGFSQTTYSVGHRGGQIERVKANMRRLAHARATMKSRVRIHVYFHKYRKNLSDVPAMEAFAHELGFEFLSDWAFLMPLEKLLAHEASTLSEAERAFADENIVPAVSDSLMLTRQHGGCSTQCELIEQLVLDHRGRVSLCCATFDSKSNVIGNYLDLTWSELQHHRYAHATCAQCTAVGAHALYSNVSHQPLRDALSGLAEESLHNGVPRATSIRLPILPTTSTVLATSA